jgi:hypothetical protein
VSLALGELLQYRAVERKANVSCRKQYKAELARCARLTLRAINMVGAGRVLDNVIIETSLP